MLYFSEASLRSGLARAQSGHSRSSNSTMATRAPGGGLSAEGSCTWVPGAVGANCAWALGAAAKNSTAAVRPDAMPDAIPDIRPARGCEARTRRAKERDMCLGRLRFLNCNGWLAGKSRGESGHVWLAAIGGCACGR